MDRFESCPSMGLRHIVIHQPDDAKAYAGLVLLNEYFSSLERKEWSAFRRSVINKELLATGKLTCKYCGRDDLTVSGSNIATLDHITPRCEGGKDIDENVIISCCGCNKHKSNASRAEFEKSLYLNRKILSYGKSISNPGCSQSN